MFIKSAIISVLFASTALAAPTSSQPSSLGTRQTGDRCEAHIYMDKSKDDAPVQTTRWNVEIYTIANEPMASYQASDPADIHIYTAKGLDFVIEGEPDTKGNPFLWRDNEYSDAITLSYGSQKWNGKDCRRFINKFGRASNSYRHQFDWWCDYDC